MTTGVGATSKERRQGESYNTRHEVWNIAHELGSPIYALRHGLIVRLLPGPEPSLRFLDVGCGTGDYARVLLERGHRVDAIDVSDSAVREALTRIPERLQSGFRVQVGDFRLLGEQANYDGILCSEVLEHVQDDEALLSQLHALLFPQGMLVLSVPADPSLWSQDDLFSGHVRRYTRDELVAKLEKAGFVMVNFWSYGFPILKIYSRLKLVLLGGETVSIVAQAGMRRRAVRLVGSILKGLVWMLDRHFLRTNRGIGFVVHCQKSQAGQILR